MSDTESTQHNPNGDGEHAARPDGAAPPEHASPAEHAEGTASPSSAPGELESVKRRGLGRRGAWAVAAVLCVAAGVVGSLLAAHAVARSDAAKDRRAFQLGSTGIASAVRLAVQREEELVVSASTFFAANPTASPAEFDRWVNWAHTVHRFPELNSLGHVSLLRAPELAAFGARVRGHAIKRGAFPVVPPSGHRYFCLTAAELSRSAADSSPAGLDYCAHTPALLLARDSGRSTYVPIAAGHIPALAIETPIYRGHPTPRSVLGRTGASVGWLREVLVPGVILRQILRGYPNYAVSIGYREGSAPVTFTGGTPQPGGQSATSILHDGWTVQAFAAPLSTDALDDGDALALLIGGVVLSALAGLLIFLLGGGRARPGQTVPKQPGGEVHDSDLYDALTGLPNRALTLDRAECMVARAGRQTGMLAGALFIDIDWLKDVNEKLGQAAGDHLLKIVAERLEAVVRTGDTVGRLGGDEFIVLVESAARGVRLDSLARRVIESLHKPVELEDFGPNFFFTASIGVAFGRYTTHEDLMRDAQLALYAAKAAGKDRYTLFNANMRSVIESRSVLEDELNSALQEKQLFLLYQPIYDLTTKRVVGLEALVRWLHPKQGVLSGEDFVSLAEETGLVVPIGRWALEEACTRAAAWNVSGHRVGISIKVSANQLNRDGFATDVRRALQQSGIEPSLLTLEIGETTVMGDLAAAAERLQEIKRLGVRVAIDDFGGSGYARHSDLQRIPLDFLKVDRSSLAASEGEDYRSWLLEAILIVGRDLSLTVIATGIETFEQMTTLEGMGCTLAQGSFMGKPTAADAVEGLFNAAAPLG